MHRRRKRPSKTVLVCGRCLYFQGCNSWESWYCRERGLSHWRMKTQRARLMKTRNSEHNIQCTCRQMAHTISLHMVRALRILHTQTTTVAKVEEIALFHWGFKVCLWFPPERICESKESAGQTHLQPQNCNQGLRLSRTGSEPSQWHWQWKSMARRSQSRKRMFWQGEMAVKVSRWSSS